MKTQHNLNVCDATKAVHRQQFIDENNYILKRTKISKQCLNFSP